MTHPLRGSEVALGGMGSAGVVVGVEAPAGRSEPHLKPALLCFRDRVTPLQALQPKLERGAS